MGERAVLPARPYVFGGRDACPPSALSVSVQHLVHEFQTETLVNSVHVETQQSHEHDFKDEVSPRDVRDAAGVEHDGSGVERQYVGELNQGQRLAPEPCPDGFRNIRHTAVSLQQQRVQQLETGSALLLVGGVVDVCLQERLPDEVPLPWGDVVCPLQLFGAVQLTPFLPLEEEEVNLAVVVGEGALPCMTLEARIQHADKDDSREEKAVEVTVRDAERGELSRVVLIHPGDKGEVDGDEPHLACRTVENPAELSLLARHPGELTVGTVKEVGAHEHQYCCDVHPQTVNALIGIRPMKEQQRR